MFSWCGGGGGPCSSPVGANNTTSIVNSTIANNDGGIRGTDRRWPARVAGHACRSRTRSWPATRSTRRRPAARPTAEGPPARSSQPATTSTAAPTAASAPRGTSRVRSQGSRRALPEQRRRHQHAGAAGHQSRGRRDPAGRIGLRRGRSARHREAPGQRLRHRRLRAVSAAGRKRVHHPGSARDRQRDRSDHDRLGRRQQPRRERLPAASWARFSAPTLTPGQGSTAAA